MSNEMMLAIGRALGMMDGLYATLGRNAHRTKYGLTVKCAMLIQHDRMLIATDNKEQ